MALLPSSVPLPAAPAAEENTLVYKPLRELVNEIRQAMGYDQALPLADAVRKAVVRC